MNINSMNIPYVMTVPVNINKGIIVPNCIFLSLNNLLKTDMNRIQPTTAADGKKTNITIRIILIKSRFTTYGPQNRYNINKAETGSKK